MDCEKFSFIAKKDCRLCLTMKFLEKINFNYVLIIPLLLLCIQWLVIGKYIAFILTLIFGFVLFAIIEQSTAISDNEE